MDEFIPKRNIIKSKHDKPWMNGYLKKLIRIRNRWNGTFDRTQKPEHRFIRDSSRRICRKEIKFAKKRYYGRLKSDLSSGQINIKRFWGIMNHKGLE